MLIAGMGVAAALAFVLGLGALTVWALRRFGGAALSRSGRVPMEVVQRVSLGPKTQLAVVRVGEKVMAVSLGEGGVQPLFELAAEDRERVLASSTVPVPLETSRAAQAGIDRVRTPASLFAPRSAPAAADRDAVAGRPFTASLSEALHPSRDGRPAAGLPTSTTNGEGVPARMAAPSQAPAARRPQFAQNEPREVPAFLTTAAQRRSAPAPRPVALPSAFPALLLLGLLFPAVSRVGAQGATATPPAPPVLRTPAVTGAAAPVTAAPQAATPQAATPRLAAPQPAATGAVEGLRRDSLAPRPPAAPALKVVPPTAPAVPPGMARPSRRGNGASVSAQGTATSRPTSLLQLDSTPPPTSAVSAEEALMRLMPQVDLAVGGATPGTGLRLNGTVGVVVMMGLLTLLPTLLLMMTGFTRILIVLNFLKQALGTQTAPPGALVASLALLLTGFVMGPTLTEVNRQALTPWMDGKISQVEMMQAGVKPLRAFMLRQTKEADLATFIDLSRMERPATAADVPLHVLMAAFVAGELRTAFQIGFAIYLPFIIIDTVVASVLMSMGMFMLPPAMISLPFKLLLFVLVDGWNLTITSLVQSFK